MTTYYERNREKKLAYEREQRKRIKNDPVLAERSKAYQRAKNRRLRDRVLDLLGRACKCCGEGEVKFLAVDHIQGGGRKERVTKGWTGNAFYYSVLRHESPHDHYQILCHNCNMAKGAYGVCPHQEVSCAA